MFAGKPAYEMLECDPDWAPSLHLGHTEVKATNTDRFKRFRRRATRSKQQQPTSLGTNNIGPEADLEAHLNQPSSPGTDHTEPEAELDNAAPSYSGKFLLAMFFAPHLYTMIPFHLAA